MQKTKSMQKNAGNGSAGLPRRNEGTKPLQTQKPRKGSGAMKKKKAIVICGIKNSGKTTLLVRLVQAFSEKGLRVAVIKHDGHDFTCDIPGTDSYRFQAAGAYGTAVFSGYRTFIHKLGEPDLGELMKQFPEADLLFIEGMKESSYPKIEVIRKAISEAPVSNPEGRFLIVTDWEQERFGEPAVGFEELEKVMEQIWKIIEQ